MPRRTPFNPFEQHDREVKRLKDELYEARSALVGLMPHEARIILWSYLNIQTAEEWYRWPDETAEKIGDLCTDVTQRKYEGYIYEQRAKCPLCGDGPQSFYDGNSGFKLPEGLRRHLVGYGNARECPVFGAARALARDFYQSVIEPKSPAPNWSALRGERSRSP